MLPIPLHPYQQSPHSGNPLSHLCTDPPDKLFVLNFPVFCTTYSSMFPHKMASVFLYSSFTGKQRIRKTLLRILLQDFHVLFLIRDTNTHECSICMCISRQTCTQRNISPKFLYTVQISLERPKHLLHKKIWSKIQCCQKLAQSLAAPLWKL